MNGAVYISFFQGQLESVLEQVVQLAVQEISRTVGSSLNALLLETAVKEQENRRLRLQLQARDGRGPAAGDERADPEPHASGGQGTEPGAATDTRRREQRGRVVDQLKSVMKQVLDFAVRELTKIVEASFDDLLLEITKMETEQQVLEEKLGKSSDRGGGGGRGGGRRRGSENDSMSPSDSEDAREELAEVTTSKEASQRDDPARPPILSVSQDWVPILDKVFGQKWCSEINEQEGGGGGRSLSEAAPQKVQPVPAPSLALEPSPSSPQQDPRWTPLEDMEVFSPDEDAAGSKRSAEGGASSAAPGSSARRSSASMLHRLLTLPSQLLEDDNAAAKETLVALATDGSNDPPPSTPREEEEEEEEEEGEDKGKKRKRRRVWSECEECGRRFSRMSLLKAHRQTHIAEGAAGDTAAPSSPPSSNALVLRCSECGKRFSSATRLHSHLRTQH